MSSSSAAQSSAAEGIIFLFFIHTKQKLRSSVQVIKVNCRYDFRTRKAVSKEDAEKMGIKMKDQKDVTLETEYEKVAQV